MKVNNTILKPLFLAILFFVFLFTSCNGSSSENSDEEYPIEGQTDEGFEDGTYCADVTYYNPNTGTSNDYTLEVEVQQNEVVQINFGNGGYLDNEHMTPEVLDENGECTISSDRDYEYSIKLKDKDCGYTDDVNPETDEDLPRYTLIQCFDILNLNEQERRNCLQSYDKDDVLSENGFKILETYVNNIRAINDKYNSEKAKIQREDNKLKNEINEGYILNIESTTAYGIRSQLVTIKKRGVKYLLEVRSGGQCTMGTATFDENSAGWQNVFIKQYPDIDHWSGFSMRIIDSGF
jgi:hypothetical protein